MARKHFANAIISKSAIVFDEWMEELRNQHDGAVPKDQINRVAKTVLRKCDPNQYLLSHATIVASVDTYAPPGSSTGRKMLHGCQIDVRWPDFRIKPGCESIINNNGDAWERSLLLSTYKTFIGAHNYLEHIQIPALSKGFIVDAIARDLGSTCYIDILVATDKKHNLLIQDILTGQISAFSMGCVSLFTICTSCGNVAADDSQLCPCVQFIGKGKMMQDKDGTTFPVAELIGHVSVPNSNQFIEASWVRNPAFRGAVRRQILNPDQNAVSSKLVEVASIHELRRDMVEAYGIARAASVKTAQDDQGGGQGGGQTQQAPGASDEDVDLGGAPDDAGSSDAGSSAPAEDESKKSLNEMVTDAQKSLMQTIVDDLGEKLKPKPEDVGTAAPAPSIETDNNNLLSFDKKLQKQFPNNPSLVKWASKVHNIIVMGPRAIRTAGLSARDLIILSWIEDRLTASNHSADLYKVAMRVGSIKNFPSERSFLAACTLQAGRNFSAIERDLLVAKGKIASLA